MIGRQDHHLLEHNISILLFIKPYLLHMWVEGDLARGSRHDQALARRHQEWHARKSSSTVWRLDTLGLLVPVVESNLRHEALTRQLLDYLLLLLLRVICAARARHTVHNLRWRGHMSTHSMI